MKKKAVEFGNPFSGMKADRKLDKNETLRAIRFSMAAEYEATQLYTQLADSITDKRAQKVLRDIAEEELVHAGEFLAVIKELNPEEEGFYQKGEKEVAELIRKTARIMISREKSKADIIAKGFFRLIVEKARKEGIDPKDIINSLSDMKTKTPFLF